MCLPVILLDDLILGPSIIDSLIDNFVRDGWAVCDGFLSPDVVALLAKEAKAEALLGAFRPAGIGRGEGRGLHPEIRQDNICWLDGGSLSPVQQTYWNLLDSLRLALNRSLFLGLFDFEAHFAIFPPQMSYKKHLDRFQTTGLRTVSCVLYLTENWVETDGGALRLFLDRGFHDVIPIAGRFVCFFSHQFYHEVRPASRERLSLAGWLRVRSDLPTLVV